ncbi:MAG TPA: DUF3237 family protein, partial [Polyangia bacterium]
MSKPTFKYYFTLHATGAHLQSQDLGEVAGGARLNLTYNRAPEAVSTRATDFLDDWMIEWLARPGALAALQAVVTAPDWAALEKPLAQLKSGKLSADERAAVARTLLAITQGIRSEGAKPATTDALRAGDLALEWYGVEAEMLSGGDWALVRKDGVAAFQGRFTMRTRDGVLIDCALSAAVDLLATLDKGNKRAQVPLHEADGRFDYAEWRTVARKVPATFALQFETPTRDESWAGDKYRFVNAWKYARLGRGQFVGVGAFSTGGSAEKEPITGIDLHVYEVF